MEAYTYFLLAFGCIWMCGLMTARAIYLKIIQNLRAKLEFERLMNRPPIQENGAQSDTSRVVIWGRN
jgi:hypothetical protein